MGRGIELCGSSSCLGSLRSLLNTEGILTCQCFCWVMDLWYKCEVLLLLDGVGCYCLCLLLWNLQVLLLGVLWRCGGFWWHWWFDFYGLKLFLSGTYWFHICIQLCSCWVGILLYLVFQYKRQLILHTFLISIYNKSVIPMFTPFKLQYTWTFRSPLSKKHIGKQFSHIRKCHLSPESI